MAEEDILYGKNRHLFGGIEPSDMKVFKLHKGTDNTITIEYEMPDDTIIDGQTLSTVAGVVIRRKSLTGSAQWSGKPHNELYPKDEFDGELVADVKLNDLVARTRKDKIVDTVSFSDTTRYYYAAFPYSTQGVYNRSSVNSECIGGAYVPPYKPIYGYKLNMNDMTVTTLYNDAENSLTPITRNDSTINMGSWQTSKGTNLWFMPKPCLVYGSGVVKCYLDPDDYGYDIDGNNSKIDSLRYTDLNAMMEWPKIYVYRHYDKVNKIYTFKISDQKYEDGWDCICNYDADGNEIDHFYTAIYPAISAEQGSDFPLKSMSDQFIAFSTNNYKCYTTVTTVDSICALNGRGWGAEKIQDRLLTIDLLVMMTGTIDLKSVFGSGTSKTFTCGERDAQGMFIYDDSVVKVFGMEAFWSSGSTGLNGLNRYIGNFCYQNTTQKIKPYDNTDYVHMTNSSISGYGSNGTATGYLQEVTATKYGLLPLKLTSNDDSYADDYFRDKMEVYISTFSGNDYGTVLCTESTGPFGYKITKKVSSGQYVGTALSFKPPANAIVNVEA